MPSYSELTSQFKTLQEQAKEELQLQPTKLSSLTSFIAESKHAIKFIFLEKENIFFSILQIACIALGYYIWVQFIDWIPQDLWGEKDAGIADFLLFAWSFVCVGITAYPLSILTACMGASYTLYAQGKESTIADCLKMVLPRIWPLWIFSWFDGWLTVKQILNRLPKKNDRTPATVKIARELAYQAWKIVSLGFIPALVYGRPTWDACKDSLALLKERFLPLAKLRFGYSVICWIVGIGAYISMFFFYPVLMENPLFKGTTGVSTFYIIAGVPIILASLIILLFFRPIYIILSTRLYLNLALSKGIPPTLPKKTSATMAALVFFILLVAIIGITILYRNEIGLTQVLQNLATTTN